MNPSTLIHAPLLSSEQLARHSRTPLRPTKSVFAANQCTPYYAKEGVDAETASIVDVEATFLGSSHVTSKCTIDMIFFLNEELVPINIENIPGNYTLFKLVFII